MSSPVNQLNIIWENSYQATLSLSKLFEVCKEAYRSPIRKVRVREEYSKIIAIGCCNY